MSSNVNLEKIPSMHVMHAIKEENEIYDATP